MSINYCKVVLNQNTNTHLKNVLIVLNKYVIDTRCTDAMSLALQLTHYPEETITTLTSLMSNYCLRTDRQLAIVNPVDPSTVVGMQSFK